MVPNVKGSSEKVNRTLKNYSFGTLFNRVSMEPQPKSSLVQSFLPEITKKSQGPFLLFPGEKIELDFGCGSCW